MITFNKWYEYEFQHPIETNKNVDLCTHITERMKRYDEFIRTVGNYTYDDIKAIKNEFKKIIFLSNKLKNNE